MKRYLKTEFFPKDDEEKAVILFALRTTIDREPIIDDEGCLYVEILSDKELVEEIFCLRRVRPATARARDRRPVLPYGRRARSAAGGGLMPHTNNLIALLEDAFDALEGQTDSELLHFEDDEEERECAPTQYAARKIREAIDMLGGGK